MNVLITGGSGPVGTAITDHLKDRYDFVNLDFAEHPDPDVETVDADMTDYDAVRPHVEGADAVIHLARVTLPEIEQDGGRTVSWSDELAANLRGMCAVFGAAVDAGVEKIVYGSSNHAVGMYEYDHRPDVYYPEFDLTVDRTVPPRPDSMYGVSKVFGEALGRMCADANGVRFYGLRLCSVAGPERETPTDYAEGLLAEGADPESDAFRDAVQRKRAMWHSRRDLAHLVDRCLRDETVTADVFYGVSDNDSRWFDIDHARDALGYEPEDNGDEWPLPGE